MATNNNLVSYLRPLVLAAGFLFIVEGLNILITEHPAYSSALSALYTLMLWTFYLYLVFLFLSILVGALDTFNRIRQNK